MLYRKVKQDKSPINAQTYRLEELTEWIEQGGMVGWIISDGYIAVDIDNVADSDIVKNMLDFTEVKYRCHKTLHGKHFIFKIGRHIITQSSRLHTPIGIRVDTRTPNKGYIVLPINDPNRTVLVQTDLEEVDEIPNWLIPLKISPTNDDYVGRDVYQGRNDALQRQVGRLKAARLSPPEIKVAVVLINQFVFPEPLAQHELETTVLREENLVLTDSKSETMSHDEIAEKLMQMYDIKYINGEHYIYNDGVYQLGASILKKVMLDISPKIKRSQRDEVLDYIAIKTEATDRDTQDHFVNLKNGIYSLKEAKLLPHSPEIAGRNRVNFEWNEDKRVASIDAFILDLADGKKERAKLILQMIGYSITKTIREQKLFFLYGETASNGKSTLLNVMRQLIGHNNIANVSLDQIAGNNFMQPELDNKLAAIYADLSHKFLQDVSAIKNIVTGDTTKVARKYGQPFDMTPFCKLIFATNELPKAGKDKGWYRRMLIIPFEKQFTDTTFDIGSVTHPDALNYLGTIALKEYQKLYDLPANKDEKWADYMSSMQYLDEYKEETDSAYAFFNQLDLARLNCYVTEGQRLYLKSDLFNKYKEFVEENGLKEKSKISFGKTIKEHFQETVKSNKHYWIIPEEADDSK